MAHGLNLFLKEGDDMLKYLALVITLIWLAGCQTNQGNIQAETDLQPILQFDELGGLVPPLNPDYRIFQNEGMLNIVNVHTNIVKEYKNAEFQLLDITPNNSEKTLLQFYNIVFCTETELREYITPNTYITYQLELSTTYKLSNYSLYVERVRQLQHQVKDYKNYLLHVDTKGNPIYVSDTWVYGYTDKGFQVHINKNKIRGIPFLTYYKYLLNYKSKENHTHNLDSSLLWIPEDNYTIVTPE